MTVKLLAELQLEFLSLKISCTGSDESTLDKMPHCWKCHVAAQLLYAAWDVTLIGVFLHVFITCWFVSLAVFLRLFFFVLWLGCDL